MGLPVFARHVGKQGERGKLLIFSSLLQRPPDKTHYNPSVRYVNN